WQNRGLADWVRHGGSLVVVGGTDAYNDLSDSWWRKAGHASPMEDLFAQLGLNTTAAPTTSTLNPQPSTLNPVLRADPDVHDFKNRRQFVIDMTPYARQSGGAVVRFE